MALSGFENGDRVQYSDGGGTAPTGLTDTNTYYLKKSRYGSADYEIYSDAVLDTQIDITLDGVGAGHTFTLLDAGVMTEVFESRSDQPPSFSNGGRPNATTVPAGFSDLEHDRFRAALF